MIFTSLQFLIFFVVLLALLAIVRSDSLKKYILLVASFVFYGAWNAWFVPLLFFSSVFGWWCGNQISASDDPRVRKRYVWLSVIVSLGILAIFKYTNFFGASISGLLGSEWEPLDIVLPVGISFFTFQNLSYTIDLYRRKIDRCESVWMYCLFVAFFPQLVAGPIVRASEFLPQLNKMVQLRKHNLIVGAQIFLGGAIQKLVFADNLAVFADVVFEAPERFSAGTLWLSMFAYSLQIFCDFSGYTLMAIGAARVLGFELPINFRMPYLSLSITEFWRRWHISLSSWLRDYLYISLGGNRHGEAKTMINLFITMLLGGLWHGASWNFVLWGAMHGIGLAVHKYWMMFAAATPLGRLTNVLPYKIVALAVTLVFCCMLWIPFRAQNFEITANFFSGMFSGGGISWIHPDIVALLLAAVVWHLLYLFQARVLTAFPANNPTRFWQMFMLLGGVMLILIFAPIETSPFVYFQF